MRTDDGRELPIRGAFEIDMKNGAKLETVAHYGRFRTFAVSTSQSFK